MTWTVARFIIVTKSLPTTSNRTNKKNSNDKIAETTIWCAWSLKKQEAIDSIQKTDFDEFKRMNGISAIANVKAHTHTNENLTVLIHMDIEWMKSKSWWPSEINLKEVDAIDLLNKLTSTVKRHKK